MVFPVSQGPERPGPAQDLKRNPDRSPWVLLLLIPVVVPLITSIYNQVHPVLFGMPAFYWVQLAFVPMSALCTGIVYLMTRKR
jgi:hypothetical protein